jgi:DNA processing protein
MQNALPVGLPAAAYAAALASLPPLGPRRLGAILAAAGPQEAWASILAGHPADRDGAWQAAATRIDLPVLWDRHRAEGVGVLVRGDPAYPTVLADDPEAPAVLFHRGDPTSLGPHPRVTLVGTRSATRYGLGIAAQLGAELAAAGVGVVSGLALGIDGAAHEGALAGWRSSHPGGGPPVGVVAGGLDDPYPRRHARLWERVAEAGVLLSEAPLGARAVPRWRFPTRNRLLAALGDVVVVVECHVTGGSLHTARAAERRGISVGAVPGSVRSPASAGANDLLADGCFVVRDTADVLVALELARAAAVPVRPVPSARRAGASRACHRPGARLAGVGATDPAPGDRQVLDALEWEPRSLDQLLGLTGRPLGEVAAALERLASAGLAEGEGGWWVRC